MRVCVDAFIQQKTVLAGCAGDNRSFSGDASPDSFRAHADLDFSTHAEHGIVGVSHRDGKAFPGTGTVTVTFDSEDSATVHFDAHVGGQPFSPGVDANLTIRLDKDGTVSVSGDHTQFPSFEVYVYGGKNNGAIYKYNEYPGDPSGPLFLFFGTDVFIVRRH